MNAAQLDQEAEVLVGLLDEAQTFYEEKVAEAAEAERTYRKGRMQALIRCPPGTVDEKKAWVDAETSDLRYARDLAVGLEKGGLELIRSRRQVLSLLQSRSNASREEAAFARTGPEYSP